jgi:hypothetical protein
MARNLLDGPGMGYGPPRAAAAGGVPRSTVVLALLCVLLAIALAVVLLQRTPPSTAGPAAATTPTPAVSAKPTPASSSPPSRVSTPSGSATTPGTDASERAGEPAGVRAAATQFLRAWRQPSAAVRVPMLSQVATNRLTEQLNDVDPAKVIKAKPVGQLVVSQASDYAASADQKLSDKSTVRMQLVYDPASRFGWLVDTITPLQ